MVNPLSRVAMKNIIEKKDENLAVKRDAKTLSDFAKEKEQKVTSTSNNSYVNKEDNYKKSSYNTKATNNTRETSSDEEMSNMIKDLIKGQVKVKESSSISAAITLEEAVDKIKK